jgi:hypothetical protein
MIELIITACLIASPDKCHDERFKVLDGSITLIQCMMQIPDFAGWKQSHPNHKIAGWHCRPYTPEKDV